MGSKSTLKFKAELTQLMDIIIHSLYSNKEIFLRELTSNAADAIDRARFEALTNDAYAAGDAGYAIRIIPDKEAGTLTISDNGVGMTRQEVVENLGTVAKSGTGAFLENLAQAEAKDRPELIGQFGVGFYASFMVADEVTVVTKGAGDEEAVEWQSKGSGTFTVKPAEREGRGTDVILTLREDAKDYLEEWTLKGIVKKFSQFVEHPVILQVTRKGEDDADEQKDERLNEQKALWLRSKDDITEEEYAEFYRHISRDTDKPLRTIHYSVEGRQEFKALMFVPSKRPFDLFYPESKPKIHLYVNRVFITDESDKLLPVYLRFVKGLVDSSDLPLNVSRELIQDDPLLGTIKKNLVGKILKVFEEMKDKDRDTFLDLYEAFGPNLKEGVATDFGNRERLSELLLFKTTETKDDEYRSLADYVEDMPEGQDAIYYLFGESYEALQKSPHLEAFKEKGYEVLLFTDTIDEWVAQTLHTYKDKEFKAIDRGDAGLDDTDEATKAEFADLLSFIQAQVPEVKEAKLSARLRESAACLVVDGAMGAHMERLMAQLGREQATTLPRILEINADHATVKAMKSLFGANASDPRLVDHARLLYYQAVTAEGSAIPDPVAFAKTIDSLLTRDALRT